MPLYDYTCQKCSAKSEMNKKISSRDSTEGDSCFNCSEVGTLVRDVSSAMVAYSVASNGSYGSKIPSGFRDVLQKIHEKAPGSRLDKTSSYL